MTVSSKWVQLPSAAPVVRDEWLVPNPGDDLENIRLKGRKIDAQIRDSIVSGEIERTIEGSSKVTMVVHDPDRRLASSGVLIEGVQLTVEDDHRFALAGVEKQGPEFTLTFEQYEIWRLRKPRPFRRAYRDKITRAQFVRQLVMEESKRLGLDLDFVSPSLRKRQPIEGEAPKRKSRKQKDKDREPGLNPEAKLKVKNRLASSYQRRIGERALDVAENLGAPERARVALMLACIVESSIRDLRYGDRDSEGVLQARIGIHGEDVARSVEKSVHKFLTQGFWIYGGAIDLAQKHLDWGAAAIAQKTQGSGTPHTYATASLIREAQDWVNAYGGDGADSEGEITIAKRYPFVRKRNETTYAATKRLAEEVNWRRFMVERRFYFASEPDLFKSRPRLQLVEFQDGVDWIDYDWQRGMKASDVTIVCRANRWSAPPGTVALIDGQGAQVDGSWLTTSIVRGLFSPDATILARQPQKPKPEPKPETESRSLTPRSTSSSESGSAKDKALSLYERCEIIDKYTPGYSYGGGHGPKLEDLKASQALDCSSSCSLALFRAGLFDGPTAQVSGWFASNYGKPGKGKYVTVWANDGHMFIELKGLGSGKRFDTGGPGGGSGPKLRNEMRSTSGFTARHPAGL